MDRKKKMERTKWIDQAYAVCQKRRFSLSTFFTACGIFDLTTHEHSSQRTHMCASLVVAAKLHEYDAQPRVLCKLFQMGVEEMSGIERQITTALDWNLHLKTISNAFQDVGLNVPVEFCVELVRRAPHGSYDVVDAMNRFINGDAGDRSSPKRPPRPLQSPRPTTRARKARNSDTASSRPD